MSRRAITASCVIPVAVFLVLIGILHAIVNLAGLRRAIQRGGIPAGLADAALVNVTFSGAALSMLGLLLLLLLPGLRAGSRQASRVAIAIGVFVGGAGVAGYLWAPDKPTVLIFVFFGALLAVPLLAWSREFTNP